MCSLFLNRGCGIAQDAALSVRIIRADSRVTQKGLIWMMQLMCDSHVPMGETGASW